ncbi:unnamed protein product [Cylicocyclus nassatus]|uniref:Uncharacterized protein n=1 Tax=Cylicocyclus nassatus TaxID=53992 RepID=A0AA36GZI5_CYLNA|nr:unnamed protein product [Cylicocyclus nassatus]
MYSCHQWRSGENNSIQRKWEGNPIMRSPCCCWNCWSRFISSLQDHLRLSKSVKEGTKLTCELSMIVARFISEYTIYLACAVISELMIISSVSKGCTCVSNQLSIAAEHQKSHKTKPHKCDGCDGFVIKTRLSKAIVAPTAAANRYPVPAKTASCKWCLRVFVVLYRTLPHLILF